MYNLSVNGNGVNFKDLEKKYINMPVNRHVR